MRPSLMMRRDEAFWSSGATGCSSRKPGVLGSGRGFRRSASFSSRIRVEVASPSISRSRLQRRYGTAARIKMASAESPGFFGHVKVLVCLSDYRLNAQVRAPHLIVSSGPKDLAHLLCDSRSVAALVTEIWDDISHAEVKERILDIGRCISELGVTEHTSA